MPFQKTIVSLALSTVQYTMITMTSLFFVGLPFLSSIFQVDVMGKSVNSTFNNSCECITDMNGIIFNLRMNGKRILNVSEPISLSDAATKLYVDEKILFNKFLGNMNFRQINNLSEPINSSDGVTKNYVDNRVLLNIDGNRDMNDTRIVNLLSPVSVKDAVNKGYVDSEITKVIFSGDMENKNIFNLQTPTSDFQATTKEYVDTLHKETMFNNSAKGKRVTDLSDPINDDDAVSMKYLKSYINVKSFTHNFTTPTGFPKTVILPFTPTTIEFITDSFFSGGINGTRTGIQKISTSLDTWYDVSFLQISSSIIKNFALEFVIYKNLTLKIHVTNSGQISGSVFVSTNTNGINSITITDV